MDIQIPSVWGSPLPAGWAGEPRLAMFFLPLPFPLPIPHGFTFTLAREGKVEWLKGAEFMATESGPVLTEQSSGTNFVSIKVWRPVETLELPRRPLENALKVVRTVLPAERTSAVTGREFLKPYGLPTTLAGTVLEVVTPLIPVTTKGRLDVQRSIANALNASVETIREVAVAYTLASGEIRLRPPTRETLFPLVPWSSRSPTDPNDWSGIGVLVLNDGLAQFPPARPDMDLHSVQDMLMRLSDSRRGVAFAIAAEREVAAARALYVDGDTQSAVFDLQTASEVMLDNLLMMVACEAGQSVQTVRQWMKASLYRRVETRFAPLFGGTWNPELKRTAIGKWSVHVRAIRNRIAHAGFHPSREEAVRAFGSYHALKAYVRNRIKRSAARYPRTALTYLGVDDLMTDGQLRGRVAKAWKDDPGGDRWLHDYAEWRNDL